MPTWEGELEHTVGDRTMSPGQTPAGSGSLRVGRAPLAEGNKGLRGRLGLIGVLFVAVAVATGCSESQEIVNEERESLERIERGASALPGTADNLRQPNE